MHPCCYFSRLTRQGCTSAIFAAPVLAKGSGSTLWFFSPRTKKKARGAGAVRSSSPSAGKSMCQASYVCSRQAKYLANRENEYRRRAHTTTPRRYRVGYSRAATRKSICSTHLLHTYTNKSTGATRSTVDIRYTAGPYLHTRPSPLLERCKPRSDFPNPISVPLPQPHAPHSDVAARAPHSPATSIPSSHTTLKMPRGACPPIRPDGMWCMRHSQTAGIADKAIP